VNEEHTPVIVALKKMRIPHRIFRHPGPIRSLEQAARERGQQPSQIVRSILFRLSAGEFVMVLIAGPQQISWRSLRRYLQQPRLTTASEQEVIRETGYQLGAVSPFGLPSEMRILLDESVLESSEVSIGSGQRGTTVIMGRSDLLRALGDVERVQVGK
jgi:Cys-tRNA(Pro) deacylase